MKKNKTCDVCKKSFPPSELLAEDLLNQGLLKLINREHPHFNEHSLICLPDLNRYRAQFLKEAIREDIGELSSLEEEVLHSIKEQELIVDNLNEEYDDKLTFGQKVADKIALFGGSWRFILSFVFILVIWIILNAFVFSQNAFDPFPFILLNLVLSCLAALQAPVIMMSQNRQSEKDRMRAELDYKINLKAELEIRHLKSKLDQLASHQWRRLLEIQELQTELIEELNRKSNK